MKNMILALTLTVFGSACGGGGGDLAPPPDTESIPPEMAAVAATLPPEMAKDWIAANKLRDEEYGKRKPIGTVETVMQKIGANDLGNCNLSSVYCYDRDAPAYECAHWMTAYRKCDAYHEGQPANMQDAPLLCSTAQFLQLPPPISGTTRAWIPLGFLNSDGSETGLCMDIDIYAGPRRDGAWFYGGIGNMASFRDAYGVPYGANNRPYVAISTSWNSYMTGFAGAYWTGARAVNDVGPYSTNTWLWFPNYEATLSSLVGTAEHPNPP